MSSDVTVIQGARPSECGTEPSTQEEQGMTVAIVMDFEGATLDQYDEVIRSMGFSPGGKGAPGALGHWVTKTDTGIRVTDLWSTRELFDAFGEQKIGPLTAAAGIPHPPTLTFFEVHNYLTPG
jgi:hypothetical protein